MLKFAWSKACRVAEVQFLAPVADKPATANASGEVKELKRGNNALAAL